MAAKTLKLEDYKPQVQFVESDGINMFRLVHFPSGRKTGLARVGQLCILDDVVFSPAIYAIDQAEGAPKRFVDFVKSLSVGPVVLEEVAEE